MTKEDWIEMYDDCVQTIAYHLAHGHLKEAQHYDWLRMDILKRIDDLGGLDG